MQKSINRRNFLRTSSLAGTGLILGTSAITAKSYARILGANERLNFAVVGLRSRGWAHLDAVQKNKNMLGTAAA